MTKKKTVDVTDIEKLKELSDYLVKKLSSSQIVLLDGPLGAGKTQLVCFMAESLGARREDIRSPAFSLINVYENPKGNDIYHVDLFRLKNLEELESTGFWDIFSNPCTVFIEWGSLLKKEELPPKWKKLFISFQFKDKEQRILSYQFI